MKTEDIKSDKVLDARGLSSPMPVLKMLSALRSLTVGKVLEVWCADPDFKADYEELCSPLSNEYLGQLSDPEGYMRFFIKKLKNKKELSCIEK